ncbi:MAG TPA: hypothetical protein VN655_01010 [Pseudolabrys sp.]|jgi:hypothetical protein|nr:hypothetical protein [Pseudolabrys sp.]
MRMSVKLALGVAAAVGFSATANAEYFNRYTAGNWTNAEYDGGGCHYFYSVNNATGESHVNRDGNCAHIAIGRDGRPLPVVPMAQAVMPMPPY